MSRLLDLLMFRRRRLRALLDTIAHLEQSRDRWRDSADELGAGWDRALQGWGDTLDEQRAAHRRARLATDLLAYLAQRFAGDARDARALATATDRSRDYWQGRAAGLDASASLTAQAIRRIEKDLSE